MTTKKYLDEAGAAYLVSKILGLLKHKIDIEEGKELSDENFTTELKTKLEALENYFLPIASDEFLGGIKVGSGLSIDQEGILSATGGGLADGVEWANILHIPENLAYKEDMTGMSSADIDALFDE